MSAAISMGVTDEAIIYVATGMQNMGYGEDEIQEFLCILVSMKDLVITS